jgi:hypothetical protein
MKLFQDGYHNGFQDGYLGRNPLITYDPIYKNDYHQGASMRFKEDRRNEMMRLQTLRDHQLRRAQEAIQLKQDTKQFFQRHFENCQRLVAPRS